MIKKILVKLFIALINILIFFLSLFIKKDKGIIIIGGWFGRRFSDNSRYFYLYLNKYKKELGLKKVIWVTTNDEIYTELNDLGFDVVKKWSLKSIYYHLKAKYHIIDQSVKDINSYFSVRAIKINLWHGFPLKKVGNYRYENQKVKAFKKIIKKFNLDLFSEGFWRKSYLLATSKFSSDILGYAFDKKKEKIIIANYPRNDNLLYDFRFIIPKNEKEVLRIIESHKKSGYNVILYLPTFRDKKATIFLGENDKNKVINFIDFCENNKIILVTKFHFANISIHESKSFVELDNKNNIINLPHDMDIYNITKLSNILITDYSSVYFDYLLLNRPIIFFPYDLDYYKYEDRGLIFDYDEYTPGFKVYNLEELKRKILYLINNNFDDGFEIKRKILKEKIFEIKNKPGSYYLIKTLLNIKR
ncbi:hypothetical protein SU69_05480 [Thermosipho melanesiensis]|uniref:CDP-glycerol:poly(Glycerophosphate) glycerophosphotransferase n=2 Tax=Thermosipho melanesiensis TaxID=46541 RepID=A6LLY2_THEM4|nr:CDP-glycerol--poly(glycerophosphate) glycerophosphotransferase [Thermosipho melanesiensis]ABR30933.1 CDP-glycerol:poly(glycerophosphate) glycerophosphotransferase [Thermosipho melanesiensis BI429]APT74871.1 hypothetical protein BW47_05740 [Thermosipho melanesiensis]OOC35977.1 hypothetical protein SU68_05540 [Thermosipho melanesiensis]OOC38116.1 hypothetical protein SU69_05480 [Thermosipho melanesiensis]OOC38245.1 hypothetical protein SU70_05490 [Thermosipho melanesiensis]